MLTIARLFGKSPFAPLQAHMNKVSSCMKKLTEVFEKFSEQDSTGVQSLVKELSKLEHEADLTKNDIRNSLPKSIFLPIDRGQLLEILAIQDDIADKTEKVGNLLTLHPLKIPHSFCQSLKSLFEKNAEAFWLTRQVMQEMKDLLESSFGGREAERVKAIIDETSFKEYQADKQKHALIRDFFEIAETLSAPTFYLYMRLIEETNHISHISEQLANRVRMLLEVK